MISLYKIGNEDYDKNGDIILLPTEGTMKQVAGGSYNFSMKLPIDAEGKWFEVQPETVVKLPVPPEEIDSAFTGRECWIYKTNTVVYMRTGTTDSSTITYSAWDSGTTYSVGDKVTYGGNNYKCTYFDAESSMASTPPSSCPWWKKIANSTNGDEVVATFSTGSELYWISGSGSDTWWKMSTRAGLQGYVKQSQLTFYKHLDSTESPAYVITDQLFRVKKVTVDTKSQTVTVEGDHVSYDQNGNLIKKAEISQAGPLLAISKVTENLMMELRGEIATNLTDADGTFTGTFEGKNCIYALLDPDNGIGPNFDAAIKRDNWKIVLAKKTDTYKGFQLRYNRNMMGVNWVRKTDGLITRIVPVAKDEEGEELYLPNPFVDSLLINNYPVIRIEKLSVDGQVGKDDGTDTDTTWTLEALYQEMQKKAEERFSVDKVDLVACEVTVDFEMLGDTDEYPWMRDLENVLLYDIVLVADERIGLDLQMRVTEMEWDFIRHKIKSLKLTNVSEYGGKNVTGYNVCNNSLDMQKLTSSVRKSIISETVDLVEKIYSD